MQNVKASLVKNSFFNFQHTVEIVLNSTPGCLFDRCSCALRGTHPLGVYCLWLTDTAVDCGEHTPSVVIVPGSQMQQVSVVKSPLAAYCLWLKDAAVH